MRFFRNTYKGKLGRDVEKLAKTTIHLKQNLTSKATINTKGGE